MQNKEKLNSKHNSNTSSSVNFNDNSISYNTNLNSNDLCKLQENYIVNLNDTGIMDKDTVNNFKQMGQLGNNNNTIENLKSKLNQIRSKHQESKKAQM